MLFCCDICIAEPDAMGRRAAGAVADAERPRGPQVPRRYTFRFLRAYADCSVALDCFCVDNGASLRKLELAIDWGLTFTVYFLNIVIKLCVWA
jgi:hypothetical protein